MGKVIIYSSPGCTFCTMAKEYFKENNIKYEEKDVSDSNFSREMIEESGQMSVPVIKIDGEIIIGFDKEKIDKILGL
jgi:glutaredoxin-like YruB-family protein